MAVIRVRFELQRPSKGIEMSKLTMMSRETQKLLKMVADDLGCTTPEGTWVARDFYNQGVGYDAEYQLADVDQQQADSYIRAMRQITTVARSDKWSVPGIKSDTIVQAAVVAKIADDGEAVRLGILDERAEVGEWHAFDKARAAEIVDFYQAWIQYRGMLQGVIHSLYKEANPPHFMLRDLASNDLVKVLFEPEDYDRVYRSLERKTGIVLVSGWMTARRSDRRISELRMERLEPTTPLDENRLRDFFGSAPGWTGDMTADEFIDSVRNDDGDE